MFSVEKHGKERLKKSAFGHFFQRDGSCCAYNALKIITIYFDVALCPYILRVTEIPANEVLKEIPENLKKRFLSALTAICNAHILVPLNYDEFSYLEKVKKIAFGGPRIRVLVLHLTDYCNLRCHYCFIEGNIPENYKRQNMTEKVIEKAIDKFGKIIDGQSFSKPPSVVFYGGEPLANWRVIKHGLEYLQKNQEAKSLPVKMDKILITNGTLIVPEVAEKLKKHNVMVSVSIDGPKKIHDINRVFRDGKGSFQKTMAGFQILKKVGIRPTVSCVLSKESLDYATAIIHWLLDELGVKALGFNHVSIVPNVSNYDPVYEASFGETLLKVQEIIQEEYPDVYERRMNYKINAFLDRRILKADCTGCGEQISVSPDGKIGICQGYMGSRKTFGGSVIDADYDPSKDSVFIEWSQRSPLNMPQCYHCSALATCGGGCPRNADYINGSIWEVDSAFCHFARKAQEWMIWKKYEISQKK
ncbi:radical SAM protein [Candidatus Shapirobacteria bacterium]|nr:radical SAM protein [Candidatus Shapirobacteria bacterium]